MSFRELLGFKPRAEDLAARLLKEIRSNQSNSAWTYDPQQREFKSSSGTTVNLANIYREYANAPQSARSALVEKYLSMFSASEQEVPKLWALAAKGIYPAVRSRYDYMALEIGSRSEPKPLKETVTWPLVDDLCVRLLYDFGPHMGHVSREKFEIWGKDDATVRKQAFDNLAALPRPQWQIVADGVYRIRSEVAYEETFFLLDKIVHQLPWPEFAVMLPVNRGVLLAADGRCEDALSLMLTEAFRSMRENPWPISSVMLGRDEGGWQKFIPQGNVARLAHAVDAVNLVMTYKDQQDALQKYFEGIGDDVFVATFDLRQRGDDISTIYSWCSWAQGVRSLLPKTDVVMLGRGETVGKQEILMVPWDRLVEICSHYFLNTEEVPARFRVTEFPNDEEWQRLKEVGEPLS